MSTKLKETHGKESETHGAARGRNNAPGPFPSTGKPVTMPVRPPEPAAVAGPLTTGAETREFLRKVQQQHKAHLEDEMAKARDLEKEAKQIAKRVKQEARLRASITNHEERVRRLAPQLGYDPLRPITEIPPLAPGQTQTELMTVQEGRSYIRILFDSKTNTSTYNTIEPELTPNESSVLAFLTDTLIRTLEGRAGSDGKADWENHLTEAVERAIVDHSILIDDVSKQRINYYLVRNFIGFGEIEVLMRDPMIEDISCDGPHLPLYLFHRQYESIRTNIVFATDAQLDSFVIRLAQRSGKHISIADPLLDATLPEGSRLQASLSREVTTRGSSFTIRKFRGDPLTPPDLVRMGTLNAALAGYFWLAMSAGRSVLFAGGTASGKTTTLNAMSLFIPPEKKIVSIEDTREINLPHENWIAGLTRTGFSGEHSGKEAGTIDMYKLLESALRQRPEYLLVGEVRGPEAMTLFQAMATGHATYSTLHADSAASAVYRLENPPIGVPRIMLQTLNIVAVQTQVRIKNRPLRRIKEVVEILGMDPDTGDLLTNKVFQWDPATDDYTYCGKSHVLDQIRVRNNLTHPEAAEEWNSRTRVLEWMVKRGIRRIEDVANVVSEYYRRPTELLQRMDESSPEEARTRGA